MGAARTNHLDKIAAQIAKPDGLVVVRPGFTIGDLAQTPTSAVERLLDRTIALRDIAEEYRLMDIREALKVLVTQ